MSKKIGFLFLVLLLCVSAFADTRVLKVMSDKKRFTIGNDEGLSAGQKILLINQFDSSKAVAEIVECRIRSCRAQLTDPQANFNLSTSNRVSITKSKRHYAIAVSLDNALGSTFGVAAYYNFPHAPYMAGLKFRQISNSTSDIEVSGQILSLELQRHLWNIYRFQLWATSEVGIMQIKMDLTKIDATEPDIKRTEYFATVGLEGRWNLTERLRVIGGAGMLVNTIEKSYSGKTGDYSLEFETLYLTAKLGLIYFF